MHECSYMQHICRRPPNSDEDNHSLDDSDGPTLPDYYVRDCS